MSTKTLRPNSKKLVLAKLTPEMSREERLRQLLAALKAQGINVVEGKRPRPELDHKQERNEA